MSVTPEIHKSVKLFSPYGKPISKTLLTPCRPIGLSRKRKTPGSVSNTPLNCSNSSTSDATPLPVTPLNNNFSSTKIVECPITQIKDQSKRNTRDKKTAKKCLDENFEGALCRQDKSKSNMQVLVDGKCKTPSKVSKTIVNGNISVSRTDISVIHNKRSRRHTKEKQTLNKCLNQNFETACKQIKKKVAQSEESMKTIRSKKEQEILKMVNISLKKLSEDDIKSYETSGRDFQTVFNRCEEENISSDEEFQEIIKRKKRKTIIISDDESVDNDIKNEEICTDVTEECKNTQIIEDKLSSINTENINKVDGDRSTFSSGDEDFVKINDKKTELMMARKESSDKTELKDKQNSKRLKSVNSNEINSKILKQNKSTVTLLDNEDDAFTSTPEQEKNDKVELIEKIKCLEYQMKEKRKFLDDLKQAQIYRNIHNIDELKKLTELWRNGCVLGLNELLVKLQSHGPVTMQVLLNNLNISNEVAEKCLQMKINEEKESLGENLDKLCC